VTHLALVLILVHVEEIMRMRARQLLVVVLLVVVAAIARAQVDWQPTAPPLVTAQNEPWFLRADPIIWSGTYFYQAGAMVFFNGYQMVRSGSFRGVPLYTDATRDAVSVIYVPLPHGLMQPYERRRSGQLAGTSGNTAPSFPTDIGAQAAMTEEGIAVDLVQNPGPPDFAPPYDVGSLMGRVPSTGTEPQAALPSVSREALEVGGRSIVYAPRTGARPRGLNSVWVDFEGRRWFAGERAEVFDPSKFSERGSYQGFAVYVRKGESGVIYIPAVPGLVTPYKLRK
jgi:hypothetical protein